MKLLKQSTAQVISFGPFVSPTDGVTLQTGLVSALDNATTGIMLSKAGGAFAVRHATVTASTYDAYGNYRVTLDTTDTGTLGILRVQFAAAASCAPVWEDFTVVPAVVYDALVSGTDNLDVSVVQWLGTACATPTVAGVPEVDLTHIGGDAQSQIDLKDFADAGYDPVTNKVQGLVLADTLTTYTGNTPQTGDSFARLGAPAGLSVSADVAAIQADTNDIQTRIPAALSGGLMSCDVTAVSASVPAADALQLQFDGTGLTGDTYPAKQSQLGALTNTGSAVNVAAESYLLTTGTQSLNTYTATAPLDGVRHEHTDTAGAMDLYYQFDVTDDGVPSSARMTGRVNGDNDNLGVYAYNWAGSSWDQIGTVNGKAGTIDEVYDFALYTSHVGTGTNLGKVRVRFYTVSGLTSATLRIDQIYVSYAVVPASRQTRGLINDVAATTLSFNTNLTQATGFWNDATLIFNSGALAGQAKTINTYVATNGAVTFDEAFTSAPANGDSFYILHGHTHPITEIQNGLATAAALATVSGYVDTEVAAIKAKTDQLTFTVAGQVDSNVQRINDVTITGNGSTTPFNV